jgi:hypothetical protein
MFPAVRVLPWYPVDRRRASPGRFVGSQRHSVGRDLCFPWDWAVRVLRPEAATPDSVGEEQRSFEQRDWSLFAEAEVVAALESEESPQWALKFVDSSSIGVWQRGSCFGGSTERPARRSLLVCSSASTA